MLVSNEYERIAIEYIVCEPNNIRFTTILKKIDTSDDQFYSVSDSGFKKIILILTQYNYKVN